jgi:hypothetical protein
VFVSKEELMRVRLATMMTAVLLLVPVAVASANVSPSPQPQKKCESRSLIHNHCD